MVGVRRRRGRGLEDGTSFPLVFGPELSFSVSRYTILGILRWVEVDMLMPPCEDLEVLRDWAQEHGWTACNFGCSFFPTEPEHRITFQVKLSGVGTQECRLRVVDHQLGLGDPPEKTGRLHTGPDMKRYNILIRWIHA